MKRSRLLRSSFIVVSAASVSAAAAIACGSSSDASNTGTGTGTDGGGVGMEGGNAPGCPATPPMFQDTCSGTLTCTYDGGVITNACGSFPNPTTAQCSSGKWQVSGSATSCNPPGMLFDAGTDAIADDGGDGG